jgi:hypothetical protein
MNDAILTAWCMGIIGTLCASAIAAELWRSRERWRNEAERLRGRCVDLHAENANLREELSRRSK